MFFGLNLLGHGVCFVGCALGFVIHQFVWKLPPCEGERQRLTPRMRMHPPITLLSTAEDHKLHVYLPMCIFLHFSLPPLLACLLTQTGDPSVEHPSTLNPQPVTCVARNPGP